MGNKQVNHGKGMWKFNASLLEDPHYTRLVRETIANVKIDNSSARPDILWETLKCVIRGDTIKYASQKRHKNKRLEESLEHDINELEIKYAENPSELIFRELEIKTVV